MEWHIVKADKARKKWTVRGELWDGRIVKLPGHRDEKIAEQLRDKIASLNRSKHLGELPDPKLKEWIAGLSEEEAERYIALGLLPRRLLDRRLPINTLIDDFASHVQANCEDRSRWAKGWPKMVRRLIEQIGPGTTFATLDADQVKVALKNLKALRGRRKGQPISQKTKREYIFAIKSFGDWMVKKRGALVNPVQELEAPAAKGAPVLNRRPMRVAEFAKLRDYLRNAPAKYPHQMFDWKPIDRLMIYWTAVMTGFRANELRSLTKGSVDFDSNPVLITVEGWVAKNRTKATIRLEDVEFVEALKEYLSHHVPNTPLLRMPSQKAVTRALYRDLDAAGVARTFDGGKTIDFHTLRSTAMYWWLTKDRMDLLEVQYQARLKTLALVYEYVKNHVPNYMELVGRHGRTLSTVPPIKRVS